MKVIQHSCLPASLLFGTQRLRRRSAGRTEDQHGHDHARTLSGQGAEDGRQFPAIREGRLLQRHHLPPRHPRFHDPGRRLRPRFHAEEDARADRERGQQRAQERRRHRSPWRAPAIRTRPPPSSSSTSRTTTSSISREPTPQGWGYAVFGKVVEGMDVVSKIAAVANRPRRGPSPETCRASRSSSKTRESCLRQTAAK